MLCHAVIDSMMAKTLLFPIFCTTHDGLGAMLVVRSQTTCFMMTFATSTALALLFASGQVASTPSSIPDTVTQEPVAYSAQDIDALVRPSVVRIYRHVQGEIAVQPFHVDFETLSAVKQPAKVETESVDDYLSGTGFVISENGLVATNAHVVSDETIRRTVAASVLTSLVTQQLLFETRDDEERQKIIKRLEEMSNNPNSAEMLRFREEVLSFFTFTSTGDDITLVHQGATTEHESLEHLLAEGTRDVSVAYIDADWADNDKDVAILKVDDPLWFIMPAVSLATSSPLSTNDNITVFGFPGSSDVSTQSAVAVTVTSGRVVSEKELSGSKLQVYQIDAKISQGSSGGPVVDDRGNVVGIVTLETGTDEGDNFGFILPVSLLIEAITQTPQANLTTVYQIFYREGLNDQSERHCKDAIEQFSFAKAVLPEGAQAHDTLDGRIANCETMIAQGLSIDSTFDEYREMFRQVGGTTWMIIAVGGTLLVLLAVGTVILLRRVRREEKQIDGLEYQMIVNRDQNPTSAPTTPQVPSQAPPTSTQEQPPHTQ